MRADLSELVKQVEADAHSHVVVFLSDAGIHWRGESKEACQCMADVIGDCKVMTREEFITSLEEVV